MVNDFTPSLPQTIYLPRHINPDKSNIIIVGEWCKNPSFTPWPSAAIKSYLSKFIVTNEYMMVSHSDN